MLTYQVVSSSYDSAKLRQLIKVGNGAATLKMSEGETLTLSMNGPTNIAVRDGKGDVAGVTDLRLSP